MEMRIALVAITVWNILGQVPSSTATMELQAPHLEGCLETTRGTSASTAAAELQHPVYKDVLSTMLVLSFQSPRAIQAVQAPSPEPPPTPTLFIILKG